MTCFARDAVNRRSSENAWLQGCSTRSARPGLGHRGPDVCTYMPLQARVIPVCREVVSGSDGTRTRDLRRDRPSRAQRRPATSSSERPLLQVLFALWSAPLRMVEPVVQSTFGPRVDHEMLSTRSTLRLPSPVTTRALTTGWDKRAATNRLLPSKPAAELTVGSTLGGRGTSPSPAALP